MTLSKQQKARIIELAFYEVVLNMKQAIPSEKFFLFLEAYCRVFGLDYSSISFAYTSLKTKIAPSKKELAIFRILTGRRIRDLHMDFRTITKYRKEIDDGKFELYPRILNRFAIDDMRQFTIAYTKLFPAEYLHLYEYIMAGHLGE